MSQSQPTSGNRQSCIIIGPAYPLRGGIADFNEALCKSMTAQGIETSVISFYLQYPKILFPGKSQNTDGPPPTGIKIRSLISSVNPFSWLKTASLIKKERPDFIVIRYWLPFMSPALSTIARSVRKAGIKVIAITDNVIPHEKRAGDKALTSYFVNSCDAFVAMSNTVVNDLKQFTKSQPVAFSPHPVYDIFGEKISKSEAREKLGLLMGEKVILFFGFIRPYKGLDLLLHAMADDQVRSLNLKLLVAGEFYGDEEVYTKLISDLNISGNVMLHSSYIAKEDVRNFFCAADLIVQPYRSATQSGITQIAYHFERPMIVTNVGGLSEIVPDEKVGFVVDVNANAIARRISDFYLEDKENEFSANAAIEKEHFSWKSFVHNILSLAGKL